ncbi:TIGR02922 family protein [Thalassotalea sp. M1531]|uniref:TIGR02922 family protein n=1 Tax=Thalassotalea algicola TaxID=2716224 RepID=A0A7Y0LBA8_9GAMM|nr:TIGR02922 family protein [Thalassotalea algicola]NMP31395.1 TIGR02922 family protein [Thalassotalea algicola]
MNAINELVTVLYYDEQDLQLKHHYGNFPRNQNGRVTLPNDFKDDKQVIAVCAGIVNIMNKLGDRVYGESIDYQKEAQIHY